MSNTPNYAVCIYAVWTGIKKSLRLLKIFFEGNFFYDSEDKQMKNANLKLPNTW